MLPQIDLTTGTSQRLAARSPTEVRGLPDHAHSRQYGLTDPPTLGRRLGELQCMSTMLRVVAQAKGHSAYLLRLRGASPPVFSSACTAPSLWAIIINIKI